MYHEPEETARDPTEEGELTPYQRAEFTRMTDVMVKTVTENPQSYLRFLDMQTDNPDYGVNNVLLALYQNPDASLIHSREEWEQLGRKVRKSAKGIQIRVQGIVGQGVKRRRGWQIGNIYDVSETYGRKLLSRPAIAPDSTQMAALFQTLRMTCSFGVYLYPDMTQDAVYGGWGHGISISEDLPSDKAFAALARELHHALETTGYTFREAYDRKDGELDAKCVSYMLCRSMGVPCEKPDVSGIASQYYGMELKNRRENLKNLRYNFTTMRNRILNELPPQTIVQSGQQQNRTGSRRKKAVVR